MKVICAACGIEFNKPACHVKRVKTLFCSVKCHNKYQTRYQGKPCEVCGTVFKMRGNMHRYSTCPNPKCRSAKKRGERNGNWRGGVSDDHKRDMSTASYRHWRTAVYERDDYTCQLCGKRGGELQADHIKPWAYFAELRYTVSNGRTLCLMCHRSTFKEVFEWRKRLAEQASQ